MWWQLIFFFEFSPRELGKMSNLTSIFFRWVVQPPTSFVAVPRLMMKPVGRFCGGQCLRNKSTKRNQLSHEKKTKTALLSIESWLVNRDPYFMVYEIIAIELGSLSSPIYTKQPGALFSLRALVGLKHSMIFVRIRKRRSTNSSSMEAAWMVSGTSEANMKSLDSILIAI